MPRRFKKMGWKKQRKKLFKGIIYINAGIRNTIVSIASYKGNVVCWASAGTSGFKSSKRSSPYAGQRTTQKALYPLLKHGFKQADVIIKGYGRGRQPSLRVILMSGLKLGFLRDVSLLPHNGCRPPNKQRK